MMKDKILEATAVELDQHGLTQFRVKRVAALAGVSIPLLYSYFDNREGLIAAAIVHQYRIVMTGLVEIFTEPLKHVETAADLNSALAVMIAEAQEPERTTARLQRLEWISFAKHNVQASEGIAQVKRDASSTIMETVRPIAHMGLLADGVSGEAFARIWYALFFGQVAVAGEHALSISSDAWFSALSVLASATVRDHTPTKA
jgi:AcrR family transcriptional regulator